MEKVKISVDIPKKTKEKIDILPESNSEIIREAVRSYLTRKYSSEQLELLMKTFENMGKGGDVD